MDKKTRITLGGKRWTVCVTKLKDAWGVCTARLRQIEISDKCEAQGNLRETVIHEILHGIMWFLDEKCVKQAASDIDEALEKLGL